VSLQSDRLAEDGVTKLLDMLSSKIQILSAPIQLPGVCGLCGTSRTDDRQYLDIGIWIEMYGQFYFCTVCTVQFTNSLGGLTAEQALELQERLEDAQLQILEFQEKEAKINGVIDTLRSTGLFNDSDVFGDSKSDDLVPEGLAETISGIIERDKHSPAEASNDTTKSATEQRPNDVPKPGSNELDSWL
jgi:hypothetical protein